MTVALRAVVALVAIIAALIWTARAADSNDEAALRALYFQQAQRATLANGRQPVNCCGEYDAVKVRVTGQSGPTIFAEIIDVMKSAHGKVGDKLFIDVGKITIGLYSPFLEPIAFINSGLEPYCLSGNSGG